MENSFSNCNPELNFRYSILLCNKNMANRTPPNPFFFSRDVEASINVQVCTKSARNERVFLSG